MPAPARPPADSDGDPEGVLFALAEAVEQRDHHIAGHCQRLAFISMTLGIAMGLDRGCLLALYRGGYLHDVGKVGIPDSILFKPAALTPAEWIVMRSHAARGEAICRHLKSMSHVLPIVRHHHERWDGSGYPDGLCGERIPLLARVLQIADIYDALTSARPYKPAFRPADALRTMQEEADRGWRDPDILKLFIKVHRGVVARLPGTDRNLERLRAYVGQPRGFSDMSSRPPRCAPEDNSPVAAGGRWRTA